MSRTSAIEQKESVCAIFLDLAATFDSMLHSARRQKLLAYGIHGTGRLFRWLSNHLSIATEKFVFRSSTKSLWVLISGTAVLKSEELVGSELEKSEQKLLKGTLFFKSASPSDKLKSGNSDGFIDLKFLKGLSTFMNLELNQSFDILCTYLLYEYKGSQSGIQSIIKNERQTHGLMGEIWNYYYSERLYNLLCLKQVLSHWQDSKHVYQCLYEGFLENINSNNSNVIIESVMKQLEDVCSESIPNKESHGPIMTEMQVTRWAKFKLNEMCELLQILLLYYKDMEPIADHVFRLFKFFQATINHSQISMYLGFVIPINIFLMLVVMKFLKQSESDSLVSIYPVLFLTKMSQTQPFQFEPKYATDEEGEESLSSSQSNSEDDEKASRIGEQSCYLEVLVIIEAMELEWLFRFQNAGLEEFYLFKDKNLFAEINSAFNMLGSQSHHGPILLSWMLVVFFGGPNIQLQGSQNMVLKQLGTKSIKLGTFQYLLNNLESTIFTGNTVIAKLAHEIIYGLLSLLLSTFEEKTLGEQQDIYSLASCLLKCPHLAQNFWEKGLECGLGILLSNMINHFPMNFTCFMDMLSSLAMASEFSSDKVIDVFRNLPSYTEYADNNNTKDIAVTPNPNVWMLTNEKYPYSNKNFVIERRTTGQVYDSESGRQMIQWQCSVNGWQIFVSEIHSLLLQAASGADHINQETLKNVIDLSKLCFSVFENNSKSIPLLSNVSNLSFALIERFASVTSSPNALIANCMNVISLMAKFNPELVWTNVLKMGVLPYTTSNPDSYKDLSNFDMNGGVIGNLIASQEYMCGTYSITKAFLKLISAVSEHFSASKDQHFLACVMLVVNQIFPTFHRWRYAVLGDRNKIGELCLQIFHKLLTVPENKEQLKQSPPVKLLTLNALLCTDLGQALLYIIETGDEAIQMALEEQNSWSGGSASELIHVVRLSLSVLNRLILLKSFNDKLNRNVSDATSSSETIISSQPTYAGKKHHFVLTVSQYIFHRYDPRLTTLAVHLLKRFAKEIPISLLACLANDAEAVRDMFLVRLQSVTEDIRLKIAILEFLSVCIHHQPGLFEMFVNPSSLSGKKVLDSKEHLSCLQSVLDILELKIKGASSCRPELYLAAVNFIHSLWSGQKYLAILALKKNKEFWDHLCCPLFKENNEITEKIDNVLPHVLKILALEFLYYSNDKNKFDSELLSIVKKIKEKQILIKWSKSIRDLCELPGMDVSYADRSFSADVTVSPTFLLSAWRDFLIVVAKQNSVEISKSEIRAIMTDLFDLIMKMISDSTNPKILFLLSQLFYILLEIWKTDCIDECEVEKWYDNIGKLLSVLVENFDSMAPNVQLSITTIAVIAIKLSHEIKEDISEQFKNWIVPVCKIIKLSTVEISSKLDNFNINLPVISILLLQEIISKLESNDWFNTLQAEAIIPSLLSISACCLQIMRGQPILYAIFTFFLKLAEIHQSAKTLNTCGLIQQVCLPLCMTYGNGNNHPLHQDSTKVKWSDIYKLSLQLMASMQKTLGHFFLEDAVQFVGVHMDRMHQSLQSVKVNPTQENLDEALVTCNLLEQMIGCRAKWHLFHQESLNLFLDDICHLTQNVIAYLMRPNYLHHLVLHSKNIDEASQKIYSQKFRRLSSTEDPIEMSPIIYKMQNILFKLLAVCLSCLRQFSPPLYQLLSDRGINITEWTPLLQIGFGTPSLEQDNAISFGVMVSCVNICLRHLVLKPDLSLSPNKSDKVSQQFDK
ncbi:Nucleoporin NUP188 [Nymphon striatum]|nr:Nucleoporin NUP188 [Nymphon striatum]